MVWKTITVKTLITPESLSLTLLVVLTLIAMLMTEEQYQV